MKIAAAHISLEINKKRLTCSYVLVKFLKFKDEGENSLEYVSKKIPKTKKTKSLRRTLSTYNCW